MRTCLLFALSFFALPASAQDAPTASVVAIGGTVGVEASAWIDAMDAVEARLREAGFRLDTEGLPRLDDCAELACLRQERITRGVDVLVTLTLFVAEGTTDQVGSVVVTLVDAHDQYVGDEAVEGRIVPTVVGLALAEARTERERGAGPWLHVTGTAGAIVRIDGREAGVVPYEAALEPGHHRIEVSLGAQVMVREVDAASGEPIEIDAELGGESGGGDGGVGIALAATGAATLAAGIVMMALGGNQLDRAGECVGAAPCTSYYDPANAEPGGILTGVGVGVTVTGGVLLTIGIVIATN